MLLLTVSLQIKETVVWILFYFTEENDGTCHNEDSWVVFGTAVRWPLEMPASHVKGLSSQTLVLANACLGRQQVRTEYLDLCHLPDLGEVLGFYL